VLPCWPDEATHVFHQYVVRTGRRAALQTYLMERGVGTLIHYPVPVHLQPAYAGRLSCPGGMANTERAAAEVLSLPMYPELSEDQARRVADAVLAWDRE
jgi:dTDP-4-amino-4,6-dideoxygalactose transaminase